MYILRNQLTTVNMTVNEYLALDAFYTLYIEQLKSEGDGTGWNWPWQWLSNICFMSIIFFWFFEMMNDK